MGKIMLLNINIAVGQTNGNDDSLSSKPWIGNLFIGTFLELNGHEVTMLEIPNNNSDSLEKLMANIKREKPLLIGFSAYTETNNMALIIAKEVKRQYPDIKIVFGGPHPTLCPKDVILSKYVDFLILMEGESTIVELVLAIETEEATIKYDDIPGLVFKRDNRIIKNNPRPKIADLDLLPIIKRELADLECYIGIINVSSSRGCPNKCIYCSAAALSGSRYRVRDIRNVFMEFVLLKLMLREKVKEIYITDDTFTAIPDRAEKFAKLIFQHNLNVKWRCESRIDVMTESLIKTLAKSGLVSVQYGIESGCQDVLDKIKKRIDLEHAKAVIDFTHKAGVYICLSFMLGHYCDTHATMQKTVDFISYVHNKYKLIELVMGYNTPFPGTWQYTRMKELGMRLITERYEDFTLAQPVIETDNFTAQDLISFYKRAEPYLWQMEKTVTAQAQHQQLNHCHQAE